MKQRKVVLFASVLVLAALMAACAHRQGTNVPVSPWEQVMTTNAQIASANNAIEQAIENAEAAKLIPTDKATIIIREQAAIAYADYQLTAILNQGQTVSTASSGQISMLIGQIQKSVNNMVAAGVVGVKDPQTQQSVAATINLVGTLSQTLLTTLHNMGVIQ